MTHEPNYERDRTIGGGRHPRAWRWAIVSAVVVVAVASVAVIDWSIDRRSTTPSSRGDEYGEPADAAGRMDDPRSGVGTSGEVGGVGAGQAVSSPLLELTTLIDREDMSDLVGQQVRFEVDRRDGAGDVAFWVGDGDRRLLVVPERDRRSGLDRQRGLAAAHDAARLPAGEPIVVSGIIERIPYAEATYSWNLTRDDVEELLRRDVYVRAVAVQPAPRAEAAPR
jgi:hypothetical protein